MIGNALIAPLLFDNRNWVGITTLICAGVCAILIFSWKGD